MLQKIFVNRTLNMKSIKYIGFDMDHTLIRYQTKRFESLVYTLVLDALVQNKKYPAAIKKFKFNFSNAIRGLVIDSQLGNILKLNRYGAIRQSYHGTTAIDYVHQKKIYHSTYVDLNDPNYMAIDTSFSIAFCALYSQLVEYKDQHNNLLPAYHTLAQDTLETLDWVHAHGELKKKICDEIDQFVILDASLVTGLKRYQKYGKKLFLLTNSNYEYTKKLLDYALTPFLSKDETWQELFTFVITAANKPRFFYDQLDFLSIDLNQHTMTNLTNKLTPGIYQGGHALKFTDDLGLHGDEILYIGDHIYGDIVRLKKECNWRTALVVEELGHEIKAQHQAHAVEQNIVAAMEIKQRLEYQYVDLQSMRIDQHIHTDDPSFRQLNEQIVILNHQIALLLEEQKAFYNVMWGRVFRAGAEESYFANQVERYACIYMEKLSDLLNCSPLAYFRAPRRLLPHDNPP